MPLLFTKPEVLSLKNHREFSEKWLQERISEDPTILGLGDIELVGAEKTLPNAGRLDLLLHDEQLNRRYEVELMLGATDPSHIIRCIEYWDVERRRYPAYEHVAVLVAEDITSRFLNVMSLLAGSIPLIALQLIALRIDDKIALHFGRVLDQTELRSDDEYELGERSSSVASETDRSWWEQRSNPAILSLCDQTLNLVQELSGENHHLRYKKKGIDLTSDREDTRLVWFQPKKNLVHIGVYVPQPETWIKRFDEVGLSASLRRGNKAARVSFTAEEFKDQKSLLRDFLSAAVTGKGSE